MPLCSVCQTWNDQDGLVCRSCGSQADPFGTAQPPRLEPTIRAIQAASRYKTPAPPVEQDHFDSTGGGNPFQTLGQPPPWLGGAPTELGVLPPLVLPAHARGPREHYSIQFWKHGRWHVLVPRIRARGTTLSQRMVEGESLGSNARRVRFDFQDGHLRVLDLGAGVYRKIQGLVDLADGSRLRVGRRTIVFRRVGNGEFGGTFGLGDDPTRAILEVVQPDKSISTRFPIDRPSVIVGRKSEHADLVIANDPLISARHLQVTQEDGQFRASDLNSRNGTFLALSGCAPIEPGAVLEVGGQRLRIIEMS